MLGNLACLITRPDPVHARKRFRKGKDLDIIRKGDKLDGKFLVASIDPTAVKLKEPITSLEASIDLTKEGDLGPS